jgi:hypothetical protein
MPGASHFRHGVLALSTSLRICRTSARRFWWDTRLGMFSGPRSGSNRRLLGFNQVLNRLSYGASIFSQRSRIRTELFLHPRQVGRQLPLSLERVIGFEPMSSAWKAEALPLDDTRRGSRSIAHFRLAPEGSISGGVRYCPGVQNASSNDSSTSLALLRYRPRAGLSRRQFTCVLRETPTAISRLARQLSGFPAAPLSYSVSRSAEKPNPSGREAEGNVAVVVGNCT